MISRDTDIGAVDSMFLFDRKIATITGSLIIAFSVVLSFFAPELFFLVYLIGIILMIFPTLKGAIKSILNLKIKVDTLMVIATIGAIILGHLEDAYIILLLYNIAEILEDIFLDKAKKDLEEFTRNVPRKISKIINGKVLEVDLEDCKVGDIVLIKPGQIVPFDGVVVESNTLVDESSITGEPYPVFKPIGSKIFSGSIVLKKPLKMKIEKDFSHSFLMSIIKSVISSLKQKSKFERYVRRMANYLSPIVLMGFLTLTIWGYLTNSFQKWTYRGLALLVLGCPSAFLISTAILSYRAMSNLIKEGVLVKGSHNFEILSKAKYIALDKTGTVTLGKPVVKEIIPMDNFDPKEILRIAASVEIYSSHPIAKAIINKAREENIELLEVNEIEEILGKGIVGMLKGSKRVLVGNKDLLNSFKLTVPQRIDGDGISVYVALDNKVIGLIKLVDEPLKGVSKLGNSLKSMGIEPILITGDKKREAQRLANIMGIEKWYGEMKPHDKVEIVKKFKSKGTTIMVGDGINDAMALSEADLGIAITKPGMDIVQTSAGIEIHKWDNITKLPQLIKTSKNFMKIVKGMVYSAVIIKIFLAILVIIGFLPLWGAILGDDGLTILLSIYALKQKFSLNINNYK